LRTCHAVMHIVEKYVRGRLSDCHWPLLVCVVPVYMELGQHIVVCMSDRMRSVHLRHGGPHRKQHRVCVASICVAAGKHKMYHHDSRLRAGVLQGLHYMLPALLVASVSMLSVCVEAKPKRKFTGDGQ